MQHNLPLVSELPVTLHEATGAAANAEALRQWAKTRRLTLVGDSTTLALRGSAIAFALQAEILDLGDHPHADMHHVERIQAHGAGAYIAVGSGTINDLTKLAAARAGVSYAVLPTAPSMNGYLSANASITVHGHKQTLPAQLPAMLVLDMPLLASAPARLIRAGIGDTLCRGACQRDAYLSHRLTGSPYESRWFTPIADREPAILRSEIQPLIEALLIAGAAMTLAGSSIPASQGEHMLAHLMEMAQSAQHSPEAAPFHGETIAVTTLASLARQEQVLSLPSPAFLPFPQLAAADLRALIGKQAAQSCLADAAKKHPYPHVLHWPELRKQLRPMAMRAAELRAHYHRLGLPTRPSELGWQTHAWKQACLATHLMRGRLTHWDML